MKKKYTIRPLNKHFVLGRLITDNIVVTFEIQHYLKRKTQGKDYFATIKLDMSNVFGIIGWNFLREMMAKLGFFEQWIALIMYYVSSINYHSLLEGSKVGPFVSQHGIKQGDSLSPYLFILVLKGISTILKTHEYVENCNFIKNGQH